MFQAVGDLVTLKWVREHPLVTSTAAAAAAAYSLATFAGAGVRAAAPEEAEAALGGAAAAAVARKAPARSISWRDERGGKLAQFMDAPSQEAFSEDASASTISSAASESLETARVKMGTADEDLHDEDNDAREHGRADKRRVDKVEEEEDDDKEEEEEEEEEEERKRREDDEEKRRDVKTSKRVPEPDDAARKTPSAGQPPHFARDYSDEFESASARGAGSASGTSLGIADLDDPALKSGAGDNGEEAPSPQWGWFVSMTPPQQQMYAAQVVKGGTKPQRNPM